MRMTRRHLLARGFALLASLVLTAHAAVVARAAEPAPASAAASPSALPATRPAKHVKLLAVGNSFSGNATHYLKDIVAASGNQITFGHASIGGGALPRHLGRPRGLAEGARGAGGAAPPRPRRAGE